MFTHILRHPSTSYVILYCPDILQDPKTYTWNKSLRIMVSSVLLLKLCIVRTLTAPRGTLYCNTYLLLVYSFLPAMYIQPQANPASFSKSYVTCM